MKGTSTKLTAGAFTTWITTIVFYVLFTATFGPQWEPPPAEVVVAFTGLVSAVVAWWTPELAELTGGR